MVQLQPIDKVNKEANRIAISIFDVNMTPDTNWNSVKPGIQFAYCIWRRAVRHSIVIDAHQPFFSDEDHDCTATANRKNA